MINLFADREQISTRALFVGQRLELREFERSKRLASNPLVVTVGSDGCAVLFKYGVVVLFGLTAVEEVAFLDNIKSFINSPLGELESEELDVHLQVNQNEGMAEKTVLVKSFTVERLQIIADVLAKSVVLAHYEARVGKSFDKIEPFAEKLHAEGSGGKQARDFIRHIGDTLIMQSKMVGRAEVADKPEVLWEYPELERFYLSLEIEFEIRERHIGLERKLELISRTAETLLDLLHNKRSLRVEWYIVILIVVDIIVSLFEKVH
ncbi:RMD1 family protein [Kaarinaea lacus]